MKYPFTTKWGRDFLLEMQQISGRYPGSAIAGLRSAIRIGHPPGRVDKLFSMADLSAFRKEIDDISDRL